MNRCARVFSFVPLLLAGCRTIANLKSDMVPFGGTRRSVDFALHGSGTLEGTIFRPAAAIDAPISLVADTATLPITIPAAISKMVVVEELKQLERAKEKERERIVTHPPNQDEPPIDLGVVPLEHN